MLFLIFISSLCASEVTSIDRNIPGEPSPTEQQRGDMKNEMASIKAEIVEVKADITSLSADVKILMTNMMTVLKEVETTRDGVNAERNDEEFLDDPYENKDVLLDQRNRGFSYNQ